MLTTASYATTADLVAAYANATPDASLSVPAEARARLRTAIKEAKGWETLRAHYSLDLSKMGKVDTLRAAAALGIDARAIVRGGSTLSTTSGLETGAAAGAAQRYPISASDVAVLISTFERRRNGLSKSKARFVENVLQTIATKQGGRATERQRAVIVEIVMGTQSATAAAAEVDGAMTGNFAAETTATAETVTVTPETTTVQAIAPAANDAASQLAALIAGIAGQSMDRTAVEAIARAEVKRALEASTAVRYEIAKGDEVVGTVEGLQHKTFGRLLKACTARTADGHHLNVWLAGPAGSGKTTAAKMVAKAFGRAFHFNGAISMAHELLGFVDGNGTYHRTAFRDAFEHGGVYLFDEVDGCETNAPLLALNAALANGVCTFPDGQVERHPDCIVLAGANTWGHGATADYVGRAKIDAAFLDRFQVRLQWGYDEALERSLAGNDEWASVVMTARQRAVAAGLKVVISPRATMAGAALIAQGFSVSEAAEMTFLANVTPDQKKVLGF